MTVIRSLRRMELGELYEYLLPYYKAGLDGVIVQDWEPCPLFGSIFRE